MTEGFVTLTPPVERGQENVSAGELANLVKKHLKIDLGTYFVSGDKQRFYYHVKGNNELKILLVSDILEAESSAKESVFSRKETEEKAEDKPVLGPTGRSVPVQVPEHKKIAYRDQRPKYVSSKPAKSQAEIAKEQILSEKRNYAQDYLRQLAIGRQIPSDKFQEQVKQELEAGREKVLAAFGAGPDQKLMETDHYMGINFKDALGLPFVLILDKVTLSGEAEIEKHAQYLSRKQRANLAEGRSVTIYRVDSNALIMAPYLRNAMKGHEFFRSDLSDLISALGNYIPQLEDELKKRDNEERRRNYELDHKMMAETRKLEADRRKAAEAAAAKKALEERLAKKAQAGSSDDSKKAKKDKGNKAKEDDKKGKKK